MVLKKKKDLGRVKGISEPEMIVSNTVHCAFNKACKYFDIKLVMIPCLDNGEFDTKKLIKNTKS